MLIVAYVDQKLITGSPLNSNIVLSLIMTIIIPRPPQHY